MKNSNEILILKALDNTVYNIPFYYIDDITFDSLNEIIKIKFRSDVLSSVGCRSIKFKYSPDDELNKIAKNNYVKKFRR